MLVEDGQVGGDGGVGGAVEDEESELAHGDGTDADTRHEEGATTRQTEIQRVRERDSENGREKGKSEIGRASCRERVL